MEGTDLRPLSRNLSSVGKDILESAALFEFGVAAFLFAQSQLIEELIKRNVPAQALLEANGQIANAICCLKDVEEDIVEKIATAKYILAHLEESKDSHKDRYNDTDDNLYNDPYTKRV